MRVLVGFLVAATACSGKQTSVPPTPVGPPASLTATPASKQDVQVATVNGKPVYGSCVVAQAARGASKEQALEECIAFELLAQAAEPYATDPEVALATRTALVSQLVAREYEDKYTRPSDFGSFWDKSLEKNKRRVEHPEVRGSAYVRIPVAKNASPEEDAKAKTLAEEFAAKVGSERGLVPVQLEELAKRWIGDRAKFDYAVVPLYTNEGGLVAAYAEPLFAIPEVGRTSPAVRTPWGWDVILFSEVIPAKSSTPEEVITAVMPDIKRTYFTLWVNQIAAKLGAKVKVFDDNVPLLEQL